MGSLIAPFLCGVAAIATPPAGDETGAADGKPTAEASTWNRDIAEIVKRRCLDCHRAGGAAPFPLQDHASVANRATFIGDVVESGRMPPWLPSNHGFVGDRRLTPLERRALTSWIAAGSPIGEGAPIRIDPDPGPDETSKDVLALRMPDAGEIPEESGPAWHRGELDQHGVMLPLENESTHRVQAIRHVTSAPQAIRVASLVFDDTGAGRYLDARDPRVGFLMAADAGIRPSGVDGILLGGGDGLRWPEGFHTEVSPNSDLVAELHYRPTGRPERLQERFELELVPEEAESRPVRWIPVGLFRVAIPAGTRSLLSTPETVVPVDVDLVGLSVRALEICVGVEVVAIDADGAETVLLEIDTWDHHQRETYVLPTSRSLAGGTRILARFKVDNTASNPANPDDPPVDIRRGRRTGVLLVMLHVAAVEGLSDEALHAFGGDWVKRRGR